MKGQFGRRSAPKMISIFGAIACACNAFAPVEARVTGDPLKVDGGFVEGSWASNSRVRAYLGVPYAAPPVGNLRWREPQPVVPWAGVKSATTLPAGCIQGGRAPGSISIEAYGNRDLPVSEDCLYLNIWTPTEIKPGQKLPVMFWMHGGAFSSGSGSKVEFNGEQLAQKGMIVVAINYRLNIFGFFAHPELTRESPNYASGNYGLLDQVEALKWVHNNIAVFGGDPEKVMIIGQSAGSGAVNQLMVSPLSRGLFQRAVAMSGPVSLGGGRTLASAETDGRRFGSMISASLADLRGIPAEVLLSLYGDMKINFGPIVDGHFLPDSAGNLWKSGKVAPVPYMTGWSSHEFFEGVYDRTRAQYDILAKERVGPKNLSKLAALYDVHDDESATQARVGLFRDANFGLNTWRTAQMSAATGSPTYLYYWAHPTPAWKGQSFAENSPASLLGAYHGSQVPYVFGNLQLLDREFKPADRQLSDAWQTYLINFANTGDPNSKDAPNWPKYSDTGGMTLTFTDSPVAGPLPNKEEMEFFAKIPTPSEGGRPRLGFVNGR
ncbi:para-nitrobenzyl esterase [Sphingobium sp. B1D7B]|uniref:carboxylesterase/lipase family protein n=1 Tax=Sphingobium sp. B1D7B TaxID=2940578 RepID=UPI00222438FD|nr:carboxylesterase family protein [Sphingobium sp. B1D7B]MCW2406876.1 para-nitrobenzyl esterase [Sphingobium sp. B1D7B]